MKPFRGVRKGYLYHWGVGKDFLGGRELNGTRLDRGREAYPLLTRNEDKNRSSTISIYKKIHPEGSSHIVIGRT